MADPIKVRLKDGDGNVLHPETEWSIVQNKPFEIVKDASNNNVLKISGFDYFKFGDDDDKEKCSFGYCYITSATGSSPLDPGYFETYTQVPAFVTTERIHMLRKPDIITNTYYRYSISKNAWETFTPDRADLYFPRYFH